MMNTDTAQRSDFLLENIHLRHWTSSLQIALKAEGKNFGVLEWKK